MIHKVARRERASGSTASGALESLCMNADKKRDRSDRIRTFAVPPDR
jgi:hypothetical protein